MSVKLTLDDINQIDTQNIYALTKKINDTLHVDFGIKNLYHRMIFTACALVAKRYDAMLVKGMSFNAFRNSIIDTLSKSYKPALLLNSKLNILLDVYSEIKMNATDNQDAIDEFIEAITEISVNIISDYWNGEDVMAIFFNEFNRYKKKSEHGQVFTPDHITSLIYRLTKVDKDDVVLDAACGSGAFLVKSMCNMINECGGLHSRQAKIIKESQLFGIEFDREIFALACANMLIHKEGKTNIEQMDARSEEAAKWIRSKPISKVLMNPPFENKYGCLEIVSNVLNNVKKNVVCAFIMPDNKLEMNKSKAKKILKKHKIEKIIKLPKDIFSGVTSSIFIFEAGVPQGNNQIFSCNIENDGLETIKNRGRHDIKNKWSGYEDYWVDVIRKQNGDKSIKWLDPNKQLSYQVENQISEVSEYDFNQTIVDYLLFENRIDKKKLYENIVDCLLIKGKLERVKDRFSVSVKEL